MIYNRYYIYALERIHYKYKTKISKYCTICIRCNIESVDVCDRSQNISESKQWRQTRTGIENLTEFLHSCEKEALNNTKGLVICFCDDLYMLSLIFDKYKVIYNKFRRTTTEYVYIKYGQCLILQGSGTNEEIMQMHEAKINECERSGVLGLTTAAEIRNRIHAAFLKSRWDNKKIAGLYFEDVEVYQYIMHRMYRGGLCIARTGEYIDVDMYDMDSAHIRQMLYQKFPTSKFEAVKCDSWEDAEQYKSSGYAVIVDATFSRIKSKIDSMGVESKATTDGITLIDNTRHIIKSDNMSVVLTDVDMDIYDMCYEWGACTINFCMIAKKNPLPAYLRNTVLELYLDKADKKEKKVDYTQEKKRVNMAYGACSTKFDCKNIDDGSTVKEAYERHRNRSELSPLWSVWTAAYTRREQIKLICCCVNYSDLLAVYGDTDSVYVHGDDADIAAISDAVYYTNRHIIMDNIHAGLTQKLGTWEKKRAQKLKVIGAKQYSYIDTDGNTVIKSAGIAKEALEGVNYDEYCKGLTVKGARRHIEEVNDKYRYVLDDVTVGEGVKLDEMNYFINRMLNKY